MKQKNAITTSAALSGLFITPSMGIIQYFDASNQFSVQTSGSSVSWDIDGGGTNDASLAVSNTLARINLHAVNGQGFEMAVYSGNQKAWNVPSYQGISNNLSFQSNRRLIQFGGIYSATGFDSGNAGHIGFRFNLDGEGTTVYGWATITLTSGNPSTVTVTEWAYEDNGSPISVGAVPEPQTTAAGLAMLSLGAAGLRRWRKGRKAA